MNEKIQNRGIDYVVVITSAIIPAPNVFMLAITDPYARLIQTYACLLGWILDARAKRIVICDNTVEPCTFSPFIALALANDVELEVLTYESFQDRISSFGKGYGEGEILKFVMNNSHLLSGTECFFKITGRQYVKNFGAILKSHDESPVVFSRKARSGRDSGSGWVNTRFFKCSVDYYKRRMMDAYLGVNDPKGIYIEHLLGPILDADNIVTQFKVQPEIIGRCGTTDRVHGVSDYTDEMLNTAKAIASANKSLQRTLFRGTADR